MTITSSESATTGAVATPAGGSQSSPPRRGGGEAAGGHGSQKPPAPRAGSQDPPARRAAPAAPASWALSDDDVAALYALWHEASTRAMTVSVDAREQLSGWAMVDSDGSKVEYRAPGQLGDGLLRAINATGRGMGETLTATVNTHRKAAAMVAWFFAWPELRPRPLRCDARTKGGRA